MLPIAADAEPADVADDSGLDPLARVLATYGPERLGGRGERRTADRALRAAARRLAADARAQDPVRAERLLVALKPAWRALPAAQHAADSDARVALWDRLVRLCVEEFYAPARAPGTREYAPPRRRRPAPSLPDHVRRRSPVPWSTR